MLSHIRVLDLTDQLGLYAGRLLAELGADVARPDVLDRESDLAWNAGKRSVHLDPAQDCGREALEDLVRQSDIVLRNTTSDPFPHEQFAALNPRLIDVVIGAFDPQGSLREQPATDLTLMARSGLMWITGDPDRAPLRLPGEQAYALGGAQGVVGALTALHARHESGRGQLVTVSAFQSSVLANYREPLMWQFAGRVGKRTGNLLVRGKSGVRQVWSCRDGYVTWSFVDNPGMMRSLVEVMTAEHLAGPLAAVAWDKVLIADMPAETLAVWEEAVEGFFERHTRRDLAQLSITHGFGLSAIEDVDDVLASDHLRHRSMWRTIEAPTTGASLLVPGPLFAASAQPETRGGGHD